MTDMTSALSAICGLLWVYRKINCSCPTRTSAMCALRMHDHAAGCLHRQCREAGGGRGVCVKRANSRTLEERCY